MGPWQNRHVSITTAICAARSSRPAIPLLGGARDRRLEVCARVRQGAGVESCGAVSSLSATRPNCWKEIAVRGYDTLSHACQRAQVSMLLKPGKQIGRGRLRLSAVCGGTTARCTSHVRGRSNSMRVANCLQLAADTAFKNPGGDCRRARAGGVFKAAPAKELTIVACRWCMDWRH